MAPALHFWYLALSKIVTVGGTRGAMLRLGLDQLAFAPAFIAVFFSALLTLEVHHSPPALELVWVVNKLESCSSSLLSRKVCGRPGIGHLCHRVLSSLRVEGPSCLCARLLGRHLSALLTLDVRQAAIAVVPHA